MQCHTATDMLHLQAPNTVSLLLNGGGGDVDQAAKMPLMKAMCNNQMHIKKPRTHHSMVSRVSRNVHNDAYSFSAVICTLACRVSGGCPSLARESLQTSCRVTAVPARAYLKHRAMCMDASAFRQSFQDHRKVSCSSTAALQQCSTHSMGRVVLDTPLLGW